MKCSSRPSRTVGALIALLSAILGAAALASNSRSASAVPASPAAASVVTIHDYSFHPAVLTVARDTTVVWINRDDDVHTIKGTDGPVVFQSPALDSGSRYGFTFHRPGTYHYVCSVHPYMHGEVIVR